MNTGNKERNFRSIKNQKGFGIIDSMLALALLAIFTLGYVHFNAGNLEKKDSKVLSAQTSNYAVVFSKYMNNNYDLLVSQATTNPIFISPQSIQSNWPSDLATVNMYRQTPCLAVVNNPNTNILEAVMYYVGGNSNTTQKSLQTVRDASIFLGSKGGILINGVISGNSGWQINSGSPFLAGASQCGAGLSNNSLAVNIDLFLEWNQDLQPTGSILRGIDKTPGLLSLPGHMRNANTSKANLYFAQNNGIILDNSNPANPTKLSILYNGQGSGASTIGLGNSTASTLIGDTFQPNIMFKAGQSCNQQEVGKIVADAGMNNSASPYMARSTLICTQNNMLCGNGSYCYLPTVANNIVFQNTTTGVQDGSGNFYCPSEVPFAENYTMSTPGGQAYVFQNKSSSNVPDSINVIYGYTNGSSSGWLSWTCPSCGEYFMTDFANARDRSQLLGVDLGSITGSPIGSTTSAPATATPILGSIGEYTVAIGYSIQNPHLSCTNICSGLGSLAGNSWQALGTRRMDRTGSALTIANQNLGCACERTDFSGLNNDNYQGVGAIIGNFTSIITSVTCSNAPVYTSTN